MRLSGKRRSPITLANEQVSIMLACSLIGMAVPEDVSYGRSVKVRCPFGEIYHRDGGLDPSFRIYPESNHAYCFACAMGYSPVWLVAQAWGITARQAAAELLERAGIKPVSLADAWAAVAAPDNLPDVTLLAEALKTYCARIAPTGWAEAQFRPDVAATLSACLDLLDRVATAEDADQWLAGCKEAMSRALVRADVYVCPPDP